MVTLTAVLEALPLHRRRSANRCRSTSDGQRQELAACAGSSGSGRYPKMWMSEFKRINRDQWLS
jgi:hypothetical protein